MDLKKAYIISATFGVFVLEEPNVSSALKVPFVLEDGEIVQFKSCREDGKILKLTNDEICLFIFSALHLWFLLLLPHSYLKSGENTYFELQEGGWILGTTGSEKYFQNFMSDSMDVDLTEPSETCDTETSDENCAGNILCFIFVSKIKSTGATEYCIILNNNKRMGKMFGLSLKNSQLSLHCQLLDVFVLSTLKRTFGCLNKQE